MSLTQEKLKEYFEYSPDTGVFIRLKRLPNDVNGKSTLHEPVGFKHHVVNSSTLEYLAVRFGGKVYKLHRLAYLYMTGDIPNHVDHINGNGTDNRWDNLREADYAINNKNRCLPTNNTSGVIGVSKAFARNGDIMWKVRININGKRKSLGWYKDFDEAVKIRQNAEAEHGYHINHGRPNLK